MKPYPPLGILYITSHLKSKGFDVRVFDSTFSSWAAYEQYMRHERPPVAGFYTNLMSRPKVIRALPLAKSLGTIAIVGGPDAANYPEDYLAHGADVVVIGEGEQTLEELLPHLSRYGPSGMHAHQRHRLSRRRRLARHHACTRLSVRPRCPALSRPRSHRYQPICSSLARAPWNGVDLANNRAWLSLQMCLVQSCGLWLYPSAPFSRKRG